MFLRRGGGAPERGASPGERVPAGRGPRPGEKPRDRCGPVTSGKPEA
jgi:hypothetical protein